MLFPTLGFALFMLAVAWASWALLGRDAWRKALLVAASYAFYAAWDWRFCLLLLGSTLLNHAAAQTIAPRRGTRGARWILGGAVAANLALLGFFKYADFFLAGLNELLWAAGLEREIPLLGVVVPVAVSFFTFHGISTIVDVARGHLREPPPALDMLLYISFFPQLVAGPIVRAAHFLPQLAQPPDPRGVPLARALILILVGLFKKVVVANEVATRIVEPAFRDPAGLAAPDLWLGMWGYAVQIYCDFSAYSDIAIGCAALLGYRFPRNFDQPYRAAGPSEFWRRWHISLSSWLRDYLYKPLGGGRVHVRRNLMATMLLGGLWHGAAWTFVLWGALHGAALILERALFGARRVWTGWRRWVAIAATFHVVCLGWVLFRSPTAAAAGEYLAGLVRPGPATLAAWGPSLLILGALAAQLLPRGRWEAAERALAPVPAWALGLLFGAAMWAIDAMGPRGVAPFIYFQF